MASTFLVGGLVCAVIENLCHKLRKLLSLLSHFLCAYFFDWLFDIFQNKDMWAFRQEAACLDCRFGISRFFSL